MKEFEIEYKYRKSSNGEVREKSSKAIGRSAYEIFRRFYSMPLVETVTSVKELNNEVLFFNPQTRNKYAKYN